MRGRQPKIKIITKPGQIKGGGGEQKKQTTVTLLKRQKERTKKENMFTKSTT
jgi:hypothetical protein